MHLCMAGAAPDGRRWQDLHYAIAGKQQPGYSACGAGYFKSPKFLQADGGWANVVWVTLAVAKLAGNRLSSGTEISD